MTDRRIQRTRQLLRDALITLILQKGYEDITVQEITDHANLGRATFYLHYRDKEELLMSSLTETFEELSQSMATEDQQRPLSLIAFRHAEQNQDLYRVMFSGQGTGGIVRQINAYIAERVQKRLVEQFSSLKLPVPLEVISQHIAGSLLSLITWWLENNRPYTAEQMAQSFLKLNGEPFLRALSKAEDASKENLQNS